MLGERTTAPWELHGELAASNQEGLLRYVEHILQLCQMNLWFVAAYLVLPQGQPKALRP